MNEVWEVLEDLFDKHWLAREEKKQRRKRYRKYDRNIFLLTLVGFLFGNVFFKCVWLIIEVIYIVYCLKMYQKLEHEYKIKKKLEYNNYNSKYEDDHIEYRKYDDRLR
ncbi:MAG: hypothetical protein J5724_03330 [Ruminococcus sp.]|nr:hypothetical protein [Ruminococcus sp.]